MTALVLEVAAEGWWLIGGALVVACVLLLVTPRSAPPRRQWQCHACGLRFPSLGHLDAHLRESCCVCGGRRPHHPSCPQRSRA